MIPSSLKWRAYRLARPLVRPVMWRLRTFFTGRLHDEIALLRSEVGALREAIERRDAAEDVTADQRVRAVMADALATLALDRERRGAQR